ncbi:LOW QUALITY PROTEIN: penicillin-binding protein [Geomicrobium sp. JCM 19055]|nr:LOW QUALITY PROTEIN: penicillin-binding protein [Geomicrobium sp. JCM 19055]
MTHHDFQAVNALKQHTNFSGSILVQQHEKTLFYADHGYANRAECIPNHRETKYGIASGCKWFTAIAICMLVERGELTFETKIKKYLDKVASHVSDEITVHHLLTHTSGIADYFDEDEMDDFEELWVTNPMYRLRTVESFLPLFIDQPMKHPVGERFHYNNAGYILLGWLIEQISKKTFAEFVQEEIFAKVGMNNSGYFELDRLPPSTASGYINLPDGGYKTNIYSVPAKGGADGGAYVTVDDVAKIWFKVMQEELLSKSMTEKLLKVHVQGDEDDYGYGLWIHQSEKEIVRYHLMGYDPGVSFHTAYYPENETVVVVCSNQSEGAYEIMEAIEDVIGKR